MEARSFICLNCQCHLKLDTTQRRPESANTDKKAESEITESLSGHSRNLMKLIGDAQFPSDAPVCKECSDALLKEMDAQLSSLEEECSSYKTYLEYLKENHPSSDIPELKRKMQNMQDEERSLELQLQKLLIEEEQIDAELQQKRRLADASNEQSVELWKKYRDNLRKVMEDQDELTALEGERQYADLQYRKLTDTNVLDLCFHIWIEGNMGEINGFRLGYLKDLPVEWPEINAALGQVVLLIEVLFERLGIQHRDLVPVAMGSHSYIKYRRNGVDTQCPMYGNGSPFTGASAIDGGIRKCLELIEFMQKELRDRNKQFKPPYQIHADGIIENGVKFTAVMMLNIDSRWTRAMAMMLTNLKAAMVQCESLRPPV